MDISLFRATSKVGVPGTPGTVDLANALRRLTPKTTGALSAANTTPASSQDGHGWRTPDSIMSTGSRSAFSSLNSIQYPEKLKVIITDEIWPIDLPLCDRDTISTDIQDQHPLDLV